VSLLDVAMTKEWVAERWLVGVSLKDPTTGEDFPAAIFQHAAQQGREQAEGEFDLVFELTEFEEPCDLTSWSASSDFLTCLKNKPLASVEEVAFYNGNTKLWVVPPEWIIRPADKFSQIQIKSDGVTRPTVTSTFGSYGANPSYNASGMRVKYTAGYAEVDCGTVIANRDSDKVTGVGTSFKTTCKLGDFVGFDGSEARVVLRIVSNTELRVDRPWTYQHGSSGVSPTYETLLRVRVQSPILEYAGILAARNILITAGDLVIGAGVASFSRSIDGLSQSIGTTASAENSAYSARIKMLDAQTDIIWKRAVRDYRPIDAFVI
jgi:hypothetical protein